MKLQSLIEILIQFMRNNLSDPLDQNRTWIYPSYPKITASFPEISLMNTGSRIREKGIGDHGQLVEYVFDIDIWVKQGNETIVNSESYKNRKLLEYLSDQVTDLFLNNRNILYQQGILDVNISGHMTHPFDDEYKLYRKTLVLTVTVER